jgi:hypothetical protein
MTKKIEFQTVRPEVETIAGVDNPTEVRYGWMPFKAVYLYNGDGTVNYYIQPKNSPYHREIPKNQLIAFETFNISQRVPDLSVDAPGVHSYTYETRVKTAFEAATELLRGYSGRGYTVLNSLQGLEQETAFRIFQVVQPLDYKLGEIVSELSFAEERIVATEPIDLSHKVGEEYLVEPLRNEPERAIARRLASEMLDGAQRAETFANTILDETETTLVATASGRKEGKKSPDPLDRYLEEELGKKLPNMYQREGSAPNMEEKLNFLVERETNRAYAEENERLRRELEEMKAGRENPEPKQEEVKEILQAYAIDDAVMVGERVGTVKWKGAGKYKIEFEDGETGTFARSELQ